MKVLLVLVCLLSAATIAQNSEDKSGSGKDEMAEYSRMTEMLAGTWSVVWTKQGEDGTIKTTGQGEERWYAGPGGSPFIEENRATVNGKPSNDYASVWWNTKAQKMEASGVRLSMMKAATDSRLYGKDKTWFLRASGN